MYLIPEFIQSLKLESEDFLMHIQLFMIDGHSTAGKQSVIFHEHLQTQLKAEDDVCAEC